MCLYIGPESELLKFQLFNHQFKQICFECQMSILTGSSELSLIAKEMSGLQIRQKLKIIIHIYQLKHTFGQMVICLFRPI